MCDIIAYDVSCNTKKMKGLVDMARGTWANKVGSEKIITGYDVDVVITFVDYVDGKVVVKENLNNNTYVVSKDVWNRGVFKNIIKDLTSTVKKEKTSNKAPRVSKYVGDEKIINDVLFRVVEYAKGKVKVVAENYEGMKEMAISTWKNARFFNNIMKVLTRIVEKVKEVVEKKYELVVYNDFNRDFLGRLRANEMNRIELEFNRCDTVAEVRKIYKHYAKYVHPDLGHDKIYDDVCFKWLTSLRNVIIDMIEFWSEDDED